VQVWKAEHEGVQQELVDEGDQAAVSWAVGMEGLTGEDGCCWGRGTWGCGSRVAGVGSDLLANAQCLPCLPWTLYAARQGNPHLPDMFPPP